MTRSGGPLLVTRQKGERQVEGPLLYATRHLCDLHLTRPNTTCFPLELEAASQGSLLAAPKGRFSLTVRATDYLHALCIGAASDDAAAVWYHCAAVGYSPEYLGENAGALRQDWPRIPLPTSTDVLHPSAGLGRRVVALLDVESPVERVTAGDVRYELRPIGNIAKSDRSQVNPDAGDLAVKVGWGHAGQGGITMPAKGRLIERFYTEAELASFREALAELDLTYEQLMACLGGTCVDVYLNGLTFWSCIPKRVWTYTIGGYQVIKKWLSYRERTLLGRDLTADEARYVTEMARRIAAILMLEPALDANYERVKTETYDWGAPRSQALRQ
jgi:Type ISP C-terminal specificity domain